MLSRRTDEVDHDAEEEEEEVKVILITSNCFSECRDSTVYLDFIKNLSE
jgi:hypothetical protein